MFYKIVFETMKDIASGTPGCHGTVGQYFIVPTISGKMVVAVFRTIFNRGVEHSYCILFPNKGIKRVQEEEEPFVFLNKWFLACAKAGDYDDWPNVGPIKKVKGGLEIRWGSVDFVTMFPQKCWHAEGQHYDMVSAQIEEARKLRLAEHYWFPAG